jgi:hypothetical protein
MVRRGRYGRLRFDGPQLGFGRRLHLHARAERVVHARLSARDRWCDGDVWSALRNCLTLLAGAVCDSGAVLLHAGVADIFRKVGGRLRYLRQYPSSRLFTSPAIRWRVAFRFLALFLCMFAEKPRVPTGPRRPAWA